MHGRYLRADRGGVLWGYMKSFALLLVAAFVFSAPFVVNAARFERGEIVTITEQEFVPQNAYLAGGQVTFSSTAQKDLVMAGGKILQNGVVWGDVLAAGGSVDVIEDVRGDVRVAGGQVTLQGIIGGDVTVAGGAVTVLPGTTIAGDLVAAGGEILMQGVVNGQTKLYGGMVEVNGTLAGPVFITAQDSVRFGEKTIIGSSLTYRAPEEADIVEGAKLGEKVTFTALDIPRVDEGTIAAIVIGIASAIFIAKLLALGLAAALLATFFTNHSRSVAEMAVGRFWHSLLAGLGVVVVTPIVAVVLIATIVGMYLGFILLAIWVVVLLLGSVYQCIVMGGIASKLIRKHVIVDWKWALVGTALIFLIWLVPVIGWVVTCVVYLIAVGATGIHSWNALRARMS